MDRMANWIEKLTIKILMQSLSSSSNFPDTIDQGINAVIPSLIPSSSALSQPFLSICSGANAQSLRFYSLTQFGEP